MPTRTTHSALDLIRKKRLGRKLSEKEIGWLVTAYTAGEVPDYQMSALLMAVLWRGMSRPETDALTMAMAHSGAMLNVRDVVSPVVDKHSTGGVGDKVTIAVAPMVAACGLPVAKMTGRGLGHTGGTVDKLESIQGIQLAMGRERFVELVREHGMALAAQSPDLAPADGKMYALRDVSGTIDSIPLIAASIMSKKLAVGPSHLLLDVKVGSGAFMKTIEDARLLAETMVSIGEDEGVHTVAALSTMDQPLGRAVGNALEMIEAIDVLRGGGPEDIRTLCFHEAAQLLVMAGVTSDYEQADTLVRNAIERGTALAKLAEVIAAEDGDASQIEDPSRLPRAPYREMVTAPHGGHIAGIDTERVGMVSVRLGGGRMRKEDRIDHAVGLVLQAKIGDRVAQGEPLVEVHARSAEDVTRVREELLGAYAWSVEPVSAPQLLLGEVTGKSLTQ